MLPADGLIGARGRARGGRLGLLLVGLLLLGAVAPGSAQAHGATDPVASNYVARIQAVPAGMTARVVDGDLRLWLRVPRGQAVVILDYQGAPYLRFANGRVWANQNSEMYYFNQTPPATPPPRLKRDTPPRWLQVGSGRSYEWHDGRLHAFALEAVTPGGSKVGPWRIPLLVDGHRSAMSGTLWHRGAPSIAWLWPVAILVLCVLAGWRLNDLRIDALVARALAAVTLIGISLGEIGRNLHGRPGISVVGVVELAFILALTGWTAWRVLRGRAGSLTYFLVVCAGAWQAISLISTLLHGYVLLAVPPFVGRVATIMCIGGTIALVLPTVRLFRRENEDEPREIAEDELASTMA